MRKVRENILVAKGNYAVFPGGRNVFSEKHPVFGGNTIVPVDGQLVVYDNHSGVSLDATTILDRFDAVFATAHDTNKDGAADFLRKAAFDKIAKDYVSAFTAEGPRCGINEVVDFLFTCTHCSEPYGLVVSVEDNTTLNEYPHNRQEQIPFSSSQECCSCDGCPDTSDVSCHLVTDLVKQMNGALTTDPLKVPTFSRAVYPYEFWAARLYSTSYRWTFTPEAGTDCGSCDSVPAIGSFTYDILQGEGTDVTLEFTGNLNPSDPTLTLIGQLPNIVRQINVALDGYGSAILIRGTGKCCPITLEVNTCATGITLLDADDVLIEGTTTTPLAPVTLPGQCLNCGDQTLTETTYDYGIRVIAKDTPVPDTGCYPPNPIVASLVRKINIYPTGGFTCGSSFVRKTQKAQLPENLGYQWSWRDYASANGGSGREHFSHNKNYGPLMLPGANTRATSTFVDPSVDYCSYIVEHGLPHTNTGVSDAFRVARARTVVLIPAGDATTIASFESIANAYILSGRNPVRANATCGSDQDQVENDATDPNAVIEGYPDANGMIY